MAVLQFPKRYDQEGIISPKEHFFAEKETYGNFHVPKSVIICFEGYIMEHFKKLPNTSHSSFWTGEMVYLNKQENDVALLGNFGIGGAAAAHILEILIAAGVKKFIVVGHAGCLQKSISVGTMILIEKAIRDEGVSDHYLRPEKFAFPSKALMRSLKDALDNEKISYSTGGSWTVASMYRETKDQIVNYRNEGILTVEMELASLFAVASFRKTNIASLLVVSDIVAFETWDEHLNSTSTTEAMFRAIEIAVSALKAKS